MFKLLMCFLRLRLKEEIVWVFFNSYGSVFQLSAPEKDRLVWNKSIREKGLIKLSEPYLKLALHSKASR